MRVIFAGTPDAAVPSLRALAASTHRIAAVITRDDAPLGRKRVPTPSPVAVAATDLGLDVIKANRLDAAVTSRIAEHQPDLGVIVAYGGLVREPLLSIPVHGWINLHFSLLPRWRGAAPVQRALMAGDATTGATVFQLVPELDAGDIIATQNRSIGADETAGELLDSMAVEGAELLAATVDRIANGQVRPHPQQGDQQDDATYAAKLSLDDARLTWTTAADQVYNRIRAVTPEPGAFSSIGDTRIKVLVARPAPGTVALQPGQLALSDGRLLVGTGTDPIEAITVQPAGKRAMPAADWYRGLPAGARFVVDEPAMPAEPAG